MKTKEEYVEFVKEWKITHEALVKLQLYVKKYLIKAVNKNEKYKLTDEELKTLLGRYEEIYSPNQWSNMRSDKVEQWVDRRGHYYSGGYRWILRENLREMYEIRSLEKEQFKNSLVESVGV